MAAELAIERLPADDAAADREIEGFLESCLTGFAQQTVQWRTVTTCLDSDEAMWLACRRGSQIVGLLPAYRYEGPLGAILVSAAQAGALGGVTVARGEDVDTVYAVMLSGFAALAQDLGCDLATVLTNPFHPDREAIERHLDPHYTLENRLQAIDLEKAVGEDGELLEASGSLQRNVRRARAAPTVIDEEQSRESVDEWIAIHEERFREIGATPLPARLFHAALDEMVPADHARFFFVRLEGGGEMVAGGLYLYAGEVFDAFMPSIKSEFAELRAGHLLGWHSIRWARERGFRYYNWQASPPEGGVHRFKQQWGSSERSYCYLTRVTGDASPYLAAEPYELAMGYPWHFVLPFDQVGGVAAGSSGASSRAGAWNALERPL